MLAKKNTQHIQIVRSTLPELFLMGAKSSALVREALKPHYATVGETIVNNVADVRKLIKKSPDLVFVGIKNVPLAGKAVDAKACISDYLEKHSIQYVGSAKQARNLGRHKDLAKQTVRTAGLPTAGFFVTRPGEYRSTNTLPLKFPLFIKPTHRDQGAGIDASSVIRSFSEYENKVESIFTNYKSSSLVEQYLIGREFTVAILQQPGGKLLTMPVEIITEENSRGDRIMGSNNSAKNSEQIVAVDSLSIKESLSGLAEKVFIALGGRDFGRIDIRMSDAGTAYFLEANLPPGLGHDYFAQACEINRGMSYEAVIAHIAGLGMHRAHAKPTGHTI